MPRSSLSSSSSPFPLPTSWTKKLVASLPSFGGRRNEHSAHSDLTEENLQEHNRRQAAVTSRNSKCSPYYKGLTDQSLAIGRRRISVSSPEGGSHTTTVHSSSSSISSVIGKMVWRSRFNKNNKRMKKEEQPAAHHKPVACRTKKTTLLKEMGVKSVSSLDMKGVGSSGGAIAVVNDDGKPLRERVSEPESKQTLPRLSSAKSEPKAQVGDDDPATGEPYRGAGNDDTALKVAEQNPNLRDINGVTSNKDKGASVENMLVEEFVWATKHRPKALKDFICNRDKALSLQGPVKDWGHYIFEGPPGVGKRTMIWALLREVYGAEKVQAREVLKVFDLKGESQGSIEVIFWESTQHVEVSVSKLKGYEKHVIVELIKENHNRFSKKAPQNIDFCRAMILYEADMLSTDALLYLRWLLERYKHTKIFFCCSDASKLQPIGTLCTVIKLSPPSKEEVVEVLEFIAKQEGIFLRHQLAEKFADSSKNNLRQAIRSFEATYHKRYLLTDDQPILTGWEDVIAMIAKKITEEQSPRQLFMIRGKLQTLLEHDVSTNFIFESLVEELKKLLSEPLQHQLKCLYQNYNQLDEEMFKSEKQMPSACNPEENAMKFRNNQQLMRIEEFIARFMSRCKLSMTDRIGGSLNRI